MTDFDQFGVFGLFKIVTVIYIESSQIDVVVVALLFYVHGKHLRSCQDGQLT